MAQSTPPVTAVPTPATATVVLAAADTAPQRDDYAGFIKSVQGKVQSTSPSGETRAVKAGDKVRAADRIVSDTGGAASLVLRDGTNMVFGPSSQFEVKQFKYDATTQEGNVFVTLMRGSLRMISGLIGKAHPESVRIDTQTATIGIRGTDFIVLAEAAEASATKP